MRELDKKRLPVHVAIIMDGNGRWARAKNLPRVEGHLVGIDSVREIVTVTRELEIPYLTLYAFSKENWKRPRDEVKRLLELLGIFLEAELPLMLEKGIHFNMLGTLEDFPKRLQAHLTDIMQKTSRNRELFLNIALSYSGRQEIVQAVRSIIKDVQGNKIKRVDEKIFGRYLYTGRMPDPDLLIRTSGEMRISNFLLWQIAYAEIYVTRTLWPDFRRKAYLDALYEYSQRERRFGEVKEG